MDLCQQIGQANIRRAAPQAEHRPLLGLASDAAAIQKKIRSSAELL